MVVASLLFGRVWKAISPFRLINARLRPDLRRRPGRRRLHLPRAARHTGRPRSACSRSSGWSWSTPTTSTSARCGCGARSTSRLMIVGGALFGNRFYERADPFEVYSSLVAQLSVWGRRGRPLVVRSPLANLDTAAPTPGLVARRRGAVRQHGLRRVPRVDALADVHPVDTGVLDVRSRTTSACSASASASALIFAAGTMATGVGRRPRGAAAARPVRPLGGADHRRLHRGPLPELLRRDRPARP